VRVIITAGGTGGHIYPALAIINKIKKQEPDSEFLYIGTHNRMEKDIIPNYNIPFESIEIYGINRKNIFKNFKTIKCLIKSYRKCKKLIKEFDPDVVVGVGGYVTAPVIYAAHKLGYKTFIHEQNSVPGASNTFLSNCVDKIGVSLPASIDKFPKEKTVYTGNPCSEDALDKPVVEKSSLGLDPNKKLVLFVMGSLGSEKINNFLNKTMQLFNNKDYQVLYVTGKSYYDEVIKNKFPSNVKVVPYVEGLPGLMKNTDVFISRAGASTLSEIIALKVPSILIPSPYVTNNHQYKNALDLIKEDAAILLEEKQLTGDILVRKIDELLMDDNKRKDIKNNLEKLNIKDSSLKIYNILKELAGK
jgi:UDP-N-acetylglucosamine--N-acetylmuramyl-(pentapeptide) pyrophosphoryl-undecaprenol N-acetylglucosamine transferase